MLWSRAARLHRQIVPERFDLAVFLFHPPFRDANAIGLRRLRARWDAPRRLLVAEIESPAQPGGGLLRLLELVPGADWSVAARAGGPEHWWLLHRPLSRSAPTMISVEAALENAVDHWRELSPSEWAESGRRIGREALLDQFRPGRY